jgi:GAF domain-containing protein
MPPLSQKHQENAPSSSTPTKGNPMSHIVTIETKVHDHVAVVAACRRLQLQEPVQGTAHLFSGDATGLLVHLPEWQYPVVIDTLTGKVTYDNFDGHWGDQAQLHRFLQSYAVEKVKLESRKKGYTVNEHTLQDGSIKLQVIEAA